jgi:hypothetical protein
VIARKGTRARVTNGAEKTEWMPEDFAAAFLDWVAVTYPMTAGATISSHDIAKSYFPRFKVATGRGHLQLGKLPRGLGVVAKREEYKYVDRTGRRRTGVE